MLHRELVARFGEHPAKQSLLAFVRFTMPEFEVNWHHKLLCYYLEKVARNEIDRAMFFLPPRHTKSELVSRRLPAWCFGLNDTESIIASSYSADLASRMNRDVQRIIDSESYKSLFPHVTLSGENVRANVQGSWLRNNDIFEIVGSSGVYRSAGVGVGITGMGFTLGIIDDPIKDDKEASSKVVRDALYEWYSTTFYTRQAPNARIILTMTRWHEDDLAARILENEDNWHVVKLPALCESSDEVARELCEELKIDQRSKGDALWEQRYNKEWLLSAKKILGRKFHALFQQTPVANEGEFFKVARIEVVKARPAHGKRVRYWDKAGTDTGGGAQTAGVLMQECDGIYYVLDVVADRLSALDRERLIKQTAALDGTDVAIWVEQEPGSGGKESAENTVRNLAGYNIRVERVVGDKEKRAEPFSAQVEAGNVRILEGEWNREYIEQLRSFPTGKLKDKVDASGGAFNKLALGTVQGFTSMKNVMKINNTKKVNGNGTNRLYRVHS